MLMGVLGGSHGTSCGVAFGFEFFSVLILRNEGTSVSSGEIVNFVVSLFRYMLASGRSRGSQFW